MISSNTLLIRVTHLQVSYSSYFTPLQTVFSDGGGEGVLLNTAVILFSHSPFVCTVVGFSFITCTGISSYLICQHSLDAAFIEKKRSQGQYFYSYSPM